MKGEKFVEMRGAELAARVAQVEQWIASTTDLRLQSELRDVIRRLDRSRKVKGPVLAKHKAQGKAHKQKVRQQTPGGSAHKKPWSEEEDALVLSSDLVDKELAGLLGRSYAAVGLRRWKLKKSRAQDEVAPC